MFVTIKDQTFRIAEVSEIDFIDEGGGVGKLVFSRNLNQPVEVCGITRQGARQIVDRLADEGYLKNLDLTPEITALSEAKRCS